MAYVLCITSEYQALSKASSLSALALIISLSRFASSGDITGVAVVAAVIDVTSVVADVVVEVGSGLELSVVGSTVEAAEHFSAI